MRPELTAGTATVVISGELDLLAAPSLAAHLEQILSGRPQRLVLDLARVSFIDCAAARVIAGPEGSLPGGSAPSSGGRRRWSAASSSSPAWTANASSKASQAIG